jgi:glycosyltransferase involved in cell wall biosynthesis
LEATLAALKPTILQIIPELDTGGAELSTVEITGAIARAGGRALVLSEGGRMAPRIGALGGEFIPFPAATKNPLRMAWNARAIAQIIVAENVDLIHARSRAPAWSALRAAQITNKPFVTTYHGAYNEQGRAKNLYNSVMARGKIVIANSKYTAGLIRDRYQTPEDRIRVIYRGVDGAAYDPTKILDEDVARMRRGWGVSTDQRVILNPARLTSWKGQAVIIAAAALLQQRGTLGAAVFILAGDDQGRNDYRNELENQIIAAGLQGHVRLVGHVEQMPVAYRASHLALIASTAPEAFGRTAAEAQVMGCPIIATAIGAPQETVLSEPKVAADQRTGWLIPPGDPTSLADAIDSALALDPEQRSALGLRARAHVLSKFTLDAMCRQTLEVYDSLLGTSLAPVPGNDAAKALTAASVRGLEETNV